MPLHPEYESLLKQMAEAGGLNLSEMPVEQGREMYRMMQPENPEVVVGTVADRKIPGPAGDIPIRIYTPEGDGPFPIVLMFHGGGWVIGDLVTADVQSREVCRGTDAIVISVDYRLAPEHKFPAAVNDCFAALNWVSNNGKDLGGDSDRLAVAGDSAGGNLAAVVAQMAKEAGPELRFQLLVYPVTDGSCFDTESYISNAEGYMLTLDSMRWFWDLYSDAEQRLDPRASPLLANDLSDLPPTLIMTAEYDPLRDEGEAYGTRLREAGVSVETIRFDGFIHGFFAQTQTVSATRPAMQKACAALKSALN
ncbi:MAG: alpha/beta hydrolase [Pseudomonadales bacterium]